MGRSKSSVGWEAKAGKMPLPPANAIAFRLPASGTGCGRGSRSSAQDFHGALKKAFELIR